MEKKFVCLNLDTKSSELMRYWCIIHGFNLEVNFNEEPIPPEKFLFHLTIFFTDNEVEYPDGQELIEPIQLVPDHFELLGENKDVPVIKIKKTLDLLLIRKHFEKSGFKDIWPDWKPHISLSYERKQYDLSGVPLPKFPIWADILSVEKQKE